MFLKQVKFSFSFSCIRTLGLRLWSVGKLTLIMSVYLKCRFSCIKEIIFRSRVDFVMHYKIIPEESEV